MTTSHLVSVQNTVIGMSVMSLCLSVCLLVSLSTREYRKTHVETSTNFLNMFSVAAAQSNSDCNVTRYVLPVLRITSCFHNAGNRTVSNTVVVASFFLVATVAYSWWFFAFFSVTTVSIFASVNKIVLNRWMNIIQQLVWMAEFCMVDCTTQLCSTNIYEHKHFTR